MVFNQIGCGVHNEVAGDTIYLSVKGAVSIGNTHSTIQLKLMISIWLHLYCGIF